MFQLSKLSHTLNSSIARSLAVTCQRFKTVNMKINNKEVKVASDQKLIDAIRESGFDVPSKCYHSDLPDSGGICRICMVKDVKWNSLVCSCRTQVEEGMQISTTDPVLNEMRRANQALMYNYHPFNCLTCSSINQCVKKVDASMRCSDYKFKNYLFQPRTTRNHENWHKSLPYMVNTEDDTSSFIKIDKAKCINCDICVQTCKHFQNIGVFGSLKDEKTGHLVGHIGVLQDNECIQCGQCVNRCPTGALYQENEIDEVLKCINDPKKNVLFQMAPAIRVSIGEEFGLKPGEKILTKELVAGLKMLGNNVYVMDTNFSADLTIIEEGHELIERLHRTLTGKKKFGGDHMETALPMFTSCSPGWVYYLEKNYPDFIKNLSSCKSPQNMMGAIQKKVWAKNSGKDPSSVVTVSIMPCTAKKFEKSREELAVEELRDVDYSITTREVAQLLKAQSIDITQLDQQEFDEPFGLGSGAGTIFGSTGGVMEAALRTAYEVITGKEIPFDKLNVMPVRGQEGIKEATLKMPQQMAPGYEFLAGVELKIAVAHGLKNAQTIMEACKEAQKNGKPLPYHFVEFMACPSGCVGGGGQPKPTSKQVRQARASLIYKDDSALKYRKSHDNPAIQALYKQVLGEPLGHMSHELLHTHYKPRPVDYSKYLHNNFGVTQAQIRDLLQPFPIHCEHSIPKMLHKINDTYGYIIEPGVIEIANHAGATPIHILEVASSYNYFHLTPTGEHQIFICQCLNCQLKGAKLVQQTLEQKLGIKMGETTKDGKFSLHHSAWLGWCVNHAPGVMVKKRGTETILPIAGLEQALDLDFLTTSDQLFVPPNVDIYPYTRLDPDNPSFFKQYDIEQAIQQCFKLGPEGILKELEVSKLQGRGGAGFSTYEKWKAAKKSKAEPQNKYIVCNIDEGIPSAFKDYIILRDTKNQLNMILGMCMCAYTIGAHNAYIYLRYEYRNIKPDLEANIAKIKAAHPFFSQIQFDICLGAGPYVAGERSAQFKSIEGKPCKPQTSRVASSTKKGLFNSPTVINNVETFTAVPIILIESGKKWSQKAIGLKDEYGVKLYNVIGDCVQRSKVMEYPVGVQFDKILKELNIYDKVKFAEIGGATEALTFPQNFHLPLGFKRGALAGIGSIVLFNKDRDLAEMYKHKMEFMELESCKQCVPCRESSKIFVNSLIKYCDLPKDQKVQRKQILLDPALDSFATAALKTSACAHGKAVGQQFKDMAKQLAKEII